MIRRYIGQFAWMALAIALAMALLISSVHMEGSESANRLQAYVALAEERHHTYLPVEHAFMNMVRGAFGNTDRYTYFQETKAYRTEIEQYIDATYVGIGISMSLLEEGALVENVFTGSPAARADLKPGDVLVEADGVSFRGMSLEFIASKVRGEEGTMVRIGVRKGGRGNVVYLDIIRQSITITSVTMFLAGDIAYIGISSFTNHTPDEFIRSLEIADGLGIRNLIIDVRNNGGGSVYGALMVANQLLSGELITKIQYQYEGYLSLAYQAEEKDIDYRVFLLVNQNTASASEILAGAIQDNQRGLLIGERTFGKSLIQSSFELMTPDVFHRYAIRYGTTNMLVLNHMLMMDGITLENRELLGAAKITIGEYLTPNGRTINRVGITPDLKIDFDGDTVLRTGLSHAMLALDEYGPGEKNPEIEKAERILRTRGYLSRSPGEVFDGETTVALTRFQSDFNLPLSGLLDYATQGMLNRLILDSIIGRDIQLAKAFEFAGKENGP